jgi:hypothetical protein
MGFVIFGKDYAGARDGDVYAYYHDGPKADTPAGRFVLLRAQGPAHATGSETSTFRVGLSAPFAWYR